MRNELKHHHLFTHAGCMDGSATAILFMHAGGLKQNIHYVKAGRVDEALADDARKIAGKPILLVDVCVSTPEGIDFLMQHGDYTVIDHHKTATAYAQIPHFYVDGDNSACGCEHFRRWLARNGLQQFDNDCYCRLTRIIDDHDRWQLQIPYALELPKFFGFVGQKDFVERFMDVQTRFGVEKDSYWTPFEEDLMKLLRRIMERRYATLLQKFQIRNDYDADGKPIKIGWLVSAEVNNSELLMKYLDQHPEVDISAQINLETEKVSLRSRKNGVDLSVWAHIRGGGGHSTAAGMPISNGLIDFIIDDVIVRGANDAE